MPAVSVEYRNMYYPETELSTRCCLLVTKKCGTGKGPITRNDYITHIATTVYSQVLIYTAESTGASMERRKMPNLPNGSKGGFESGLT